MARSRNIKPGFFTNDVLGDLPPLARILFAGLWTIADRSGRLEDRPKKIKAQVLPYDTCDLDKFLQDLSATGFIIRYEVDGNKYIQIVQWGRHQNPHIKEPPSTIPEPCETSASTVQALCDAQPKPELAGLIPDSGFLIPDSLNSSTDDLPMEKRVRKSKAIPVDQDDFVRFWEAYPKKVARPGALKAFKTAKINGELLETVLVDIENRKEGDDWLKENCKYVPNPEKYLNQRRWEDGCSGGKSEPKPWEGAR